MTWQTDRSRIITFQHCPRKRYLEYHLNGTGIQRISKSLPLQFGRAFHEGVEVLLTAHKASQAVQQFPSPDCHPEGVRASSEGPDSTLGDCLADLVDRAVIRAHSIIDTAYSKRAIYDDGPMTAYAVNEQKALVEALLRAWDKEKSQAFHEQFEILEIEQEGRAEMGDGITLLFRPDGVVRERLTGDIYLLSWKTESSHGQWSTNRSLVDMQSMSEAFGIAQSRGYSVEGVLYLYATKGTRRMDDYLGFRVQDSPLVYGWVRGKGEDEEWAWKYRWSSEDDPKRNQQLPKGFRKVSVWDHYDGGVKAWVEALGEGEIQPRHINALEMTFPQSLPVSRRGDEIERWRRQIVNQEGFVRYSLSSVEGDAALGHQIGPLLDAQFPQYTHSCFSYNSRCPFYEICFTPAVAEDPIGSGLYQIRVANHPEKGEDAE